MTAIRTVLFDLDGTFADTARDLARCLNLLLREEGREALPFADIRPQVSHGATALVHLGFGVDANHPDHEPLRQRLLTLYDSNLAVDTVIFDGIESLLQDLTKRGMNWGIVTNKPSRFTDPLMRALGYADRACCLVSADTTANKKPHPEPMLYAAAKAGSRPEQCVYVGDAQRDIEAGRNAGMATLGALFGYLGQEDDPVAWGADGLIEKPAGVLTWIETGQTGLAPGL